MSAGNTFTAARVNAIYDLLQWFRDTLPIFVDLGSAESIASGGSGTDYSWSDGSGSFLQGITHNQGGWTAATSGGTGIVVPEDGFYAISAGANVDPPTNTTTSLRLDVYDQGAATGIRNWIHEDVANIGSQLILACSGVRYLSSGDEIDLRMYHDNGTALNWQPYLSMHWINS